MSAAAHSNNSYPPGDHLMEPFNSSRVDNIRLESKFGTEVDLDWWTTLRGTTTDGGEFAIPKYYVGKYFWTSIKVFVFGETGGNPLPFADPGERSALEYTNGRCAAAPDNFRQAYSI